MPDAVVEAVPERPADIAEWEDLLVRLEIAPRALRVAVDDAPADSPEVLRVVTEAAVREQANLDALVGLKSGEVAAPNASAAAPEWDGRRDAEAMVHVFAQLRNRLFAQVQRRGLEVWDWRAVDADGSVRTTFRLLVDVARGDGAALEAVRAAGRSGRAAC
ncbi:MAG TPA: hypothetical protein VFE05_08720 [Longimicrobiaceae bacterium]|jgi:hypothetical protein|nr:hypothetical protein [Longimicrobiaceae bacterium]